MSQNYSATVRTAQEYYNSEDADNFYYQIWGGEDIHIGLYQQDAEAIAVASQRTIATMAELLTDITNDTRIIDLGSGYGGAARWLCQQFAAQVTCVNLSEAQNARNRKLSAEAGMDQKITVCDASFESIPAADNSFDIAWSQDAILHSGNRRQVLVEVDRVLQPGGEFIFTDPMQADDCPAGVLQNVLSRIHLDTLGSFAFYRDEAARLGWDELAVEDLTPQLVLHYTRVLDELMRQRQKLAAHVSSSYIDRMLQGLEHWIEAGQQGYLAWGIMHFQKPI